MSPRQDGEPPSVARSCLPQYSCGTTFHSSKDNQSCFLLRLRPRTMSHTARISAICRSHGQRELSPPVSARYKVVVGEIVYIVVAFLERLAVPRDRSACQPRWAASYQLNRWVHCAHLQGSIPQPEAIFTGRHVTDLPWAIHFIPKAPAFDVVWVLNTVLAAQIAPARPVCHIAVLHQIGRALWRPCAKIDRQKRVGLDSLTPGEEFVGSELVGFDRIPGAIQQTGPVLLGPPRRLASCGRYEVATWLADDGNTELTNLCQTSWRNHPGRPASTQGHKCPNKCSVDMLHKRTKSLLSRLLRSRRVYDDASTGQCQSEPEPFVLSRIPCQRDTRHQLGSGTAFCTCLASCRPRFGGLAVADWTVSYTKSRVHRPPHPRPSALSLRALRERER
jgi:hypothetical protein